MTDAEIAALAAGLTQAHREATLGAWHNAKTGHFYLLGEDDGSYPESLADCISGILTPLGLRLRAHLQQLGPQA